MFGNISKKKKKLKLPKFYDVSKINFPDLFYWFSEKLEINFFIKELKIISIFFNQDVSYISVSYISFLMNF